MSIRAVIFDLGGVLVRTAVQSGRRKWERILGLSQDQLLKAVFESSIAVLATLGRVPERTVWDHVAATLGLSARQLSEFRQDFWSGEQLDSMLVRFVRSLRPEYKTAILSNAWSNARDVFVRQYGAHRIADLMIISAEEGVAKPDVSIYRIAANRLGVHPHETVFVDDVVENVQGAQMTGMWGVHFKNTKQSILEVQKLVTTASQEAARLSCLKIADE